MDNIQKIVDMIVYESSSLKCQDEIASIHSVTLEIENRLMDLMRQMREQEIQCSI